MSQTEHLSTFNILSETIDILIATLDCTYIEALAETLQNLALNQEAQQVDGLPDEQTCQQLNELYKKITLSKLSAEDMRKVIQLLFLQAIKTDKIQANHQMTPDGIAFLIAFFIEKLMSNKDSIRIFDPVLGVGNLLSVVLNRLQEAKKVCVSQASEVDDMLMSIAAMSLQLQKHDVRLYHQDSLKPLYVDNSDVVVADLPIGYYPDDARASAFSTAATSGHTYAHHLLIEHSLQCLSENGWGVFIVPANLFETEQAAPLVKLLTHDYYLQSVLRLPTSLFKNEQSQKAIILVQKPGAQAKRAKEVLIGDIPSLKDHKKIAEFIKVFTIWCESVL